MRLISADPANRIIRERVFRAVFGEETGYLCIAWKKNSKFGEKFFTYPDDMLSILEWIEKNISERDIYFCPQLLSKAVRQKGNVKTCPSVWADLDEADPKKIQYTPSISFETSPGRWQGLWLLTETAEPVLAEKASRKLAYAVGADSSGWDLTQLLRVPVTYNMKEAYHSIKDGQPIVTVEHFDEETRWKLEEFLELEDVPEYKKIDQPFNKDLLSTLHADEVLQKHRANLLPVVFDYFSTDPQGDWSSHLWSLEKLLLEAGLSAEETFVVCWESAVNKYKRDGRPPEAMWQEILKAKVEIDIRRVDHDKAIQIPLLLTDQEIAFVNKLEPNFVDRYVAWCKTRSDAAWQYHQAGGFMILSSLLAESVQLPTSFGSVVPNLWFLILGDTTLTRKTTAMDMAMDMLQLIYNDCILATDGSIEGLMTALATRPGRTSVFWRDEFAGLLEAMRKRDYYAGMVEAFTKLYDGKYQKRILRRETIEVRDPIFNVFAGGIKSRIVELLDYDYVINGFLPRFIFITAEANINAFRPAGPASDEVKDTNAKLLEELMDMYNHYDATGMITLGTQTIEHKTKVNASMTERAWIRYNQLEKALVTAGAESDYPDLYTPVMDRLTKSALKIALLLAAARKLEEDKSVTVDLQDVLKSISYIADWLPHSLYIVENAGKTISEKVLDKAMILIRKGKNTRADIMRTMRWDSKQATLALETLEQRGYIIRSKDGKTEKIFPTTNG